MRHHKYTHRMLIVWFTQRLSDLRKESESVYIPYPYVFNFLFSGSSKETYH